MPQLMPFFWINSTFMMLFILFTLIILYSLKMEEMLKWSMNNKDNMMFNFTW